MVVQQNGETVKLPLHFKRRGGLNLTCLPRHEDFIITVYSIETCLYFLLLIVCIQTKVKSNFCKCT